MKRSSILVVLSALVGALFGTFMSAIPSPSDTATFWVGNFAAPWAIPTIRIYATTLPVSSRSADPRQEKKRRTARTMARFEIPPSTDR